MLSYAVEVVEESLDADSLVALRELAEGVLSDDVKGQVLFDDKNHPCVDRPSTITAGLDVLQNTS